MSFCVSGLWEIERQEGVGEADFRPIVGSSPAGPEKVSASHPSQMIAVYCCLFMGLVQTK